MITLANAVVKCDVVITGCQAVDWYCKNQSDIVYNRCCPGIHHVILRISCGVKEPNKSGNTCCHNGDVEVDLKSQKTIHACQKSGRQKTSWRGCRLYGSWHCEVHLLQSNTTQVDHNYELDDLNAEFNSPKSCSTQRAIPSIQSRWRWHKSDWHQLVKRSASM